MVQQGFSKTPVKARKQRSDPKSGATVSVPVTSVRIWFDSDIEPLFSKIVVKNASGKQVDKGDSHVDPSNDALLIVDVPPLPPGTYHVYWNVVGRDTQDKFDIVAPYDEKGLFVYNLFTVMLH